MNLIRRSLVICCLLVFFVCTSQVLTSGNAQHRKRSKKDTNTLERIPDPKMDAIRRIRAAEDWPNPIVMVNAESVYLIMHIDGRRLQEELKLADLEQALTELRLDRWSLGRVVAVQENGLRNPGENEKISQTAKEVIQMLESHKVMIELWPSG